MRGGEVEWAAEGGFKPPLGVFGLVMSLRSMVIGLNMITGPTRCLTTTRVNFRPMPSM